MARSAKQALRGWGEQLRRSRATILATIALLGGWGALTAGIASAAGTSGVHASWLTIRIPAEAVWWISGGLLLISMFGWKLLRTVSTEGLYALTRPRRD